MSEVLIGSNQNGGIDISGRLSSIQPKPDAAYSETHQSQLNIKSQNDNKSQQQRADPTIEDVDDGIKSQRVSFKDDDEDQEEEDYEAQEVD